MAFNSDMLSEIASHADASTLKRFEQVSKGTRHIALVENLIRENREMAEELKNLRSFKNEFIGNVTLACICECGEERKFFGDQQDLMDELIYQENWGICSKCQQLFCNACAGANYEDFLCDYCK